MDISELLAENRRRNALLAVRYDPLSGEGAYGERTLVGRLRLPNRLLADHPDYCTLPDLQQQRLRIAYDFEYWCARCATVADKDSRRAVPFVPNAPQRRLLAVMESRRQAGLPVRVIVLKARQWGASTLVQLYMAWVQMVLHKGWNSLICGHVLKSTLAIKRMYNLLLQHYPDELLPPEIEQRRFSRVEGSTGVYELRGRDCLLLAATARSEDAVRGYDLKMAHLTEVAFWPSSAHHNPDDVVRSVGGTVSRAPDTVVVYESTANGVGQFFHTEWLRAQAGQSDKTPVFVPWHEIERYRRVVPDCQAATLWHSLDDYERQLWNDGCTLEMIAWYHDKRQEYSSHAMMMSEFPSNDVEAFARSGRAVFDAGFLNTLRQDCLPPAHIGEVCSPQGITALTNLRFVADSTGRLKIWKQPVADAPPKRYLVAVDVGGRTDKADFSVIAVFDTIDRSRPEVVAQWRGHIDHDLLVFKAAQISAYYRQALLVVESNTLETQDQTDDCSFLLNRLQKIYRHLYERRTPAGSFRPGFQTNRRTKGHLVYTLIAAVRDHTYIERDSLAVDEMATYESDSRGGFGAMPGHHDDILITRGIALTIIAQMPQPKQPLTTADIDTLAASPWALTT